MNIFQKYGLAIGAFVTPAVLFAQNTALAATCKLNGEEIPCEQMGAAAKSLIGAGFGFIALLLILTLAGSIFWIMMIVHAASKPIENRPMWIVILVLTGFLGAIVYYFAVKRNFKEGMVQPPTAPAQPPVQPPAQQ